MNCSRSGNDGEAGNGGGGNAQANGDWTKLVKRWFIKLQNWT